MTRLLQAGKFGRFEHSFHDMTEEVLLMAAAANSVADQRSRIKPTLLERLFGAPLPVSRS